MCSPIATLSGRVDPLLTASAPMQRRQHADNDIPSLC
jgi:hypothetical protein